MITNVNKFTKFTNNKGQMVWLADDLSGRSIIRSKNFMGWLYEVAVITSYGNRITASFNTLDEAKFYLTEVRN